MKDLGLPATEFYALKQADAVIACFLGIEVEYLYYRIKYLCQNSKSETLQISFPTRGHELPELGQNKTSISPLLPIKRFHIRFSQFLFQVELQFCKILVFWVREKLSSFEFPLQFPFC